MANPNPFLFDAPGAGGMEPPNPFLSREDPTAAANPFLSGGMSAPIAPQMQPQYGAFGTPQPIADVANPFASSFAAVPPAPTMQPHMPLFGDTSAYYQQANHQQQPQHQQYHGQYGQYTQVTADNFSQPVLSTSVQSPPKPPKATDLPKFNPFAAAIDTTTPDQADTSVVPVSSEPTDNATPEIFSNKAPLSEDLAPKANAVITNQQEEIPPPPPPLLTQEESKILPRQSTDEILPPPPILESITDDEPLPPPPPASEAVQETSKSNSTATDLVTNLDGVHIDDEKVPDISIAEALADESCQQSSKPVTEEEQSEKGQESGFSGIFTNELLGPGETMAAATSVTELDHEKPEEISKEAISTDDANRSDSLEGIKNDLFANRDDVTVKANSVGASLFGGTEEPVAVSTEETAVGEFNSVHDTKVTDYNQKPESSNSSSESATPQKPKMSTGDAIFADIPSMPEMSSTGAAIFGMSEDSAKDTTGAAIFGVVAPRSVRPVLGQMSGWDDAFDKKFDTAVTQEGISVGDPFDPFGGSGGDASDAQAFGAEDFLAGNFIPPAPNSTPAIARREDAFGQAPMTDDLNNPFLITEPPRPMGADRVDESCDGPLFDDDTSKPLEPFPRLKYDGEGWEMFIRHPPKKKLTSQRFWKKVYVKLVRDKDNNPCIQLFETKDSKDAFQELPLQPAYSLSEIAHQVFDQYSKIFTLKLQYIFYKETAGIRPGQISKVQKLTGKLGFLAKAVEDADYQGVKEFASDMKKLGIPLEHSPQVSELLKLGSTNYEDLKQFTICVEEKLFRMNALRDRSLTYKTEEVQMTAVDEVYVEQNKTGHIVKQICRIRVFFISFLSDMPEVEVGVNDITRMGLEVVGRHDILPVPTEQWIRYENVEFHPIVDKKEFDKSDHIVKFQPPDACYLEILRFRCRPPRGRELPMQARCVFIIQGNKVEIRADMMIPYHHTKAFGQVPCEDVAMRIPLPECWIYQFRTEKHHLSLAQLAAGNINLSSRMGAVKSAHRRAGKVKGLERFLGTLETQTQDLMETSSGQAKYEHQHKAIVWRVPRLPKPGQGSYTNHEFVCKLQLQSYDQMPETFEKNFYVEFTQPATCVSHTVLRSVSILGGSGEPPEKFVKYLARHEYKLEIEFAEKEESSYRAAVKKKPEPEPQPEPDVGDPDFPDRKPQDSDSDSD